MDTPHHHPNHGAVLAAVTARANRYPALNAAEAGIYASVIDRLLDRLGQMRVDIPAIDKLPPQAKAAAVVVIDDIHDYLVESLDKIQTTMWTVHEILDGDEE